MSLLASYQGALNHGHYKAALYALRYLVSTSSFVVLYRSNAPTFTKYFVHFPSHQNVEAYTDATPPWPDKSHESAFYSDACWGGQIGNSLPDGIEIPLYKFRSIYGHIITRCGGPLSWKSLLQRQTSLSSIES